MSFVAVIEVEYAVSTEEEAKRLALRDADRLFQQEDVLAVTADAKRGYPITERYLADRIGDYTPHQMDVEECLAEARRQDWYCE